jgi:hypothetical protein
MNSVCSLLRISDFFRYSTGFCVSAAILAGCGGAQAPIAPAVSQIRQVTKRSSAASPLDGRVSRTTRPDRRYPFETLTAIRVSYTCLYRRGNAVRTRFTASGSASGPWSGTFTATGKWHVRSHNWAFSEAFTITSGSERIAGTVNGAGTQSSSEGISCDAFNDYLQYEIGSLKGIAGVDFHARHMSNMLEHV